MKDETILIAIALIGLVFIEALALLKGHNGLILQSVIAILAAFIGLPAGYAVRKKRAG